MAAENALAQLNEQLDAIQISWIRRESMLIWRKGPGRHHPLRAPFDGLVVLSNVQGAAGQPGGFGRANFGHHRA